jgi:subtilisin family serine protease
MASFSNFGANSVDISAPGVDILSSVPGNLWAFFSGTSMAAPHAAGVAALAASVDPALLSDPVALKNHVMDTGKPVPAMAGITVTGDMVDAEAAVGGGSALGTLNRVADNNNDFCRGGWGSKVTFDAQGGTTYRIAVGDAGGLRENTFTLKLSGPPIKAPRVTSTLPQANATGVAPGANITATFSEAMRTNSINAQSVKLSKAGTTTTIAAAVSYEPTTKKAILNPNVNLARGTAYKTTVTTGAKDLVGNPLAQNKVWSFTTAR